MQPTAISKRRNDINLVNLPTAMSDSDSFHSQEDVEQNYEQGEFGYPILQYLSLRSLRVGETMESPPFHAKI